MRVISFFAVILLIVLGLRVLFPNSKVLSLEDQRKTSAEKLLEPYLKQAKEVTARGPANQQSVTAIISDGSIVQLPKLDHLFSLQKPMKPVDEKVLLDYLTSVAQTLGVVEVKDLQLQIKSIGFVRNQNFVHLQQFSKIRLGAKTYLLPVIGGSLVAKFTDGQLKEVYSKLLAPPKLIKALVNSGLIFRFSDKEFAIFFRLLKTHPEALQRLTSYVNGLSRRGGKNFDFQTVINQQVDDQKALINNFFGQLSKTGTIRIFIDLVKANRLSLVRYGSQWMFQVDQFMDLPIHFDIEASEDTNAVAEVKNLRHSFLKFANIRGFENPQFPSGRSQEGGEAAEKAIQRMGQALQYFNDHFGWSSFSGQGGDEEIIIFTQLRSLDFKENAAWLGKIKKFVVGAGGNNLQRLNDSPSVLGHELAHAIIQHSSALTYTGESGGINEHFADIQGASIEAKIRGSFDFTVGKDTLSPAVVDEKSQLLKLIFDKWNYEKDEIESFHLNEVGIRHLYAPALSYATQYDHVEIMREHFPEGCNPSIENDNCGVHSISGVLNKAASLIISIMGLEETRTLFFNTVVYRLNPDSRFEDYLVQLYRECQETDQLKNNCEVVLASFAYVGIQHPQYPIEVKRPSKTSDTKPIPAVDHALTPSLNFCGWVSILPNENIQIFDDLYNVIVASNSETVITKGDFSDLRKYLCACVKGRSAQEQQEDGGVKNLIVEVEEYSNREGACELDFRIFNNKPDSGDLDDRDLVQGNATYCGWVSVNPRSRNVHIIDNKFDVAILASGYNTLTKGDYSDIYRRQCGCVIGDVGQTKNQKDTVFNYFINVRDVIPRSYEHCIGLEWK